MSEKIKIICVVGATASGKTGLGVALAKRLGGEIISADSMQVYKGMPIATAAATAAEQDGIPHHLLEFLEPTETFSVAEFVKLARELVFDIHARGKVPIVVGGTGLFTDNLVADTVFSDVGADTALRQELEAASDDALYEKLLALDPDAAKDIHPHNRKRVIRALELCCGGVSKSEQNARSHQTESPFEALYIGIGYRDRRALYDRINRRVDLMLAQGLAEEARQALQHTSATARQAIGHKELQPYLEGKATLEEVTEKLKQETRHYAKRQLTWFRRNAAIHWFYADEIGTQELLARSTALATAFLQP